MKVYHLRQTLIEALMKLHDDGGYPRGDPAGWRNLNPLYSAMPGQLTVVTGVPSSGKSEWLDALAVNLAESHGWQFTVYSPENHPIATHIAKLVEKRLRKPFGEGPTPRMTRDELCDGMDWVLERFHFLRPPEHDTRPVALMAAAYAYRDKRIDRWGVILDPWNTLDHDRGALSETDYVSHTLTHITRMAREGNLHVWLVVHPKQMQRQKDGTFPIPHPYDLIGSSHWFNKSDAIVCVHRPDKESNRVEIHVQKVRHKSVGRIGVADLLWNRATGRYDDAPPLLYDVTTGKPERYADPPPE